VTYASPKPTRKPGSLSNSVAVSNMAQFEFWP
jgi:hypothetical protein